MLLQEQKEVKLKNRQLGPVLNIQDRLCALPYSTFSYAKDLEGYYKPVVCAVRSSGTVEQLCWLLSHPAGRKSSISQKNCNKILKAHTTLQKQISQEQSYGANLGLFQPRTMFPTVVMSRCPEKTKNQANTTQCFP